MHGSSAPRAGPILPFKMIFDPIVGYYLSNFENEEKLLQSIKPLLNEETVWKPHALILMGDYYFSKKSFFKAKEFYNEIMNLKNIDTDFYNKAGNQLRLIN